MRFSNTSRVLGQRFLSADQTNGKIVNGLFEVLIFNSNFAENRVSIANLRLLHGKTEVIILAPLKERLQLRCEKLILPHLP